MTQDAKQKPSEQAYDFDRGMRLPEDAKRTISAQLRGPGAGTVWDHLRGSPTQQRLVNEAADEIERLWAALEESEAHAAEAWSWVDDALKALGVETVFDIPKATT